MVQTTLVALVRLAAVLAAAMSFLLSGPGIIRAADPPISIATTGSGSPIVFLPALGAPGAVWDDVTRALAARHRCITVSVAGFATKAPEGGADFDAVRDAVAKATQAAGGKVTLVGHSFGGSLALAVAAAHPELFSHVVVVDAYPFPPALVQPAVTSAAAAQQAKAVRTMVLGLSDEQFRAQQGAQVAVLASNPGDREKLLGWMLASDRATLAQAQSEMLATDLRERVAAIRPPLLVVGTWRGREAYGFTREKVEQQIREQYRLAPALTTAVNDQARHFVMLDDPAWLARQIAAFIGDDAR